METKQYQGNPKNLTEVILNQIERINAQGLSDIYNKVGERNSLVQSVNLLECVVTAFMSKDQRDEYETYLEKTLETQGRLEEVGAVFMKYHKLLVCAKELGLFEVDNNAIPTTS